MPRCGGAGWGDPLLCWSGSASSVTKPNRFETLHPAFLPFFDLCVFFFFLPHFSFAPVAAPSPFSKNPSSLRSVAQRSPSPNLRHGSPLRYLSLSHARVSFNLPLCLPISLPSLSQSLKLSCPSAVDGPPYPSLSLSLLYLRLDFSKIPSSLLVFHTSTALLPTLATTHQKQCKLQKRSILWKSYHIFIQRP